MLAKRKQIMEAWAAFAAKTTAPVVRIITRRVA